MNGTCLRKIVNKYISPLINEGLVRQEIENLSVFIHFPISLKKNQIPFKETQNPLMEFHFPYMENQIPFMKKQNP